MDVSIDGFTIKNIKNDYFSCDVYFNNKKIGRYHEDYYSSYEFIASNEKNKKLVDDYTRNAPSFIYYGMELKYNINYMIDDIRKLKDDKKFFDRLNKKGDYIVFKACVIGGTTTTLIGAIKGNKDNIKMAIDKLKKAIRKEYSNCNWFDEDKIIITKYESENDFVKSANEMILNIR